MPKTRIMGIINATPDSFYEESRHPGLNQAVSAALRMESEGADVLDIGGESSRPGAIPISCQEELTRTIPLIQEIKKNVRIPISIDTAKPDVAAAAIEAGASMINDITGLSDPQMVAVAVEHECDICLMHMQGSPQTMQNHPHYPEGIIPYLIGWLESRAETLVKQGIRPHRILFDPGIGFGKTVAHNLEIIHNIARLKQLGFPVLLGISRKSFLCSMLNKPTTELLSATLAVNSIAINSNVDIIRVHDVKEHRDAVDAIAKYKECVENL